MSIKQEVIDFIYLKTKEGIKSSEFDFKECNATNISQVLHADRSSISRILNQLAKSKLLIKIKGRPTIFLSRKILLSFFPSINLKDSETNLDSFKNLLTITKKFVPEKEDLSSLSKNIIKSINYSQLNYFIENTIIIIFSGEHGTGKSNLLKIILKDRRINNFYQDDELVIFSNIDDISTNFDKFSKARTLIISLKPSDLIDNLYYVLNKLSFETEMNSKKMDIFILNDFPNRFDLQDLTPYFYFFHSYNDNSPSKKLEIFKNVSKKIIGELNMKISFNKEILKLFLSKNYKYNQTQIEKELKYSISKSMLESKFSYLDDYVVTLNKNSLSSNFDGTQILYEVDVFIDDLYPANNQIITLSSTTELDVTKSNKIASTKKETMTIESMFYDKKYFHIPASENLYNTIFDSNLFHRNYHLINFITNVISKVNDGEIEVIDKHIEELPASILDLTDNIINELDISNTKIRDQIITALTNILKNSDKSNTPILLFGENITFLDNISVYLNGYYRTHIINTLLKTKDWHKEYKNLYQYLNKIEMGKGSVLITDYDPKNIGHNKILLGLNKSTYTFKHLNFSNVITISNEMLKNKLNVTTITARLIQNINMVKKELHNVDLQNKINRSNLNIFNYFQDIFTLLDTKITNELFYSLAINLSDRLDVKLSNDMLIDFIFQGNAMLENSIRNKKSYQKFNYSNKNNLNIIKEEISKINELKLYKFNENDLISLLYIIN